MNERLRVWPIAAISTASVLVPVTAPAPPDFKPAEPPVAHVGNRVVVEPIASSAPPSSPPRATPEPNLIVSPEPVRTQRQAILPSPPKPVNAAAEDPELVEELRHELAQRDAAIAGLLRRVERLEGALTAGELDQAVAGGGGAMPSTAEGAPLSAPVAQLPEQRSGQAENQPDDQAEAQAQAQPPPEPGQFEVDEEAVDRALERTLVEQGALLLPVGAVEIQPNFSYARREVDQVITELERDEFETSLTLRLGLPFETQLDANFPYRYVHQSEVNLLGPGENSSSGSGFGDIRVSLAKALLREGPWWPDLVARVFWDTDTGEPTEDDVTLGGDFNEVGGSLTALKRQDPLAFVGSVSYEHAFEKDGVRPGDEVGFAIGAFLAASPQASLRFLLNQSFADGAERDGEVTDGPDQVASSLTIGAASVLGRGVLIDVSADIGLTEDAPDYAVRISLPIRFDLPIPGAS